MAARVRSLGLLAAVLAAVALPGVAQADMTFRTVPTADVRTCGSACPMVIVAEGEITKATPAAFAVFAQKAAAMRRVAPVVLVHSPGGEVAGALRLGLQLRTIGATVVVARADVAAGRPRFLAGACASACVYAIAGGKKRIVPPESRVGVHRMHADAPEGRHYASRDALKALRGYLGAMGVDPAIVALAESVPPSDLRVLSRKEIARYRLAAGRL